LRARANGALVMGFDADPYAVERALEAGAIGRPVSHGELVAYADTIVVAPHLSGTLECIEALREAGRLHASLVIDVASVKAPVVEAARGLETFVATHPMAGAERSGADAARADLFERRTWAYVPSGDAALDARACAFIESMGANPLAVDAREHDRTVALTSHLPQLTGSAYARLLREAGPEADALCGPAAREMLRVSRMSFTMWRDILAANAANVEPCVRALAAELLEAADALRDGDAAKLAGFFSGGEEPQ
jgi:prephenate dehydrogenase